MCDGSGAYACLCSALVQPAQRVCALAGAPRTVLYSVTFVGRKIPEHKIGKSWALLCRRSILAPKLHISERSMTKLPFRTRAWCGSDLCPPDLVALLRISRSLLFLLPVDPLTLCNGSMEGFCDGRSCSIVLYFGHIFDAQNSI
jgi:hypothetical protein